MTVSAAAAAAPARAVRIGLTGGIGSGKSTVAQAWVGLGAVCVDTDAIARRLTQPGGAALQPLQRVFGAGILDGQGGLDRPAMRARVFADAQARARLEAVLHPMIQAVAHAEGERAHGACVVVFDVPLLVESAHWRARVDRILVVDCSADTQVARVAQRAGWDAATAQRVIAQQAPRAARRAVADAVLYNDGLPLTGLQAAVAGLHRAWGQPL